MRWLPSRQVALTVLLVLLVAVAGCSGGNGPATTEDGSDDSDATDTEAETDASTMTDGGSTTTAPEGDMTPGDGMTPGDEMTPDSGMQGYAYEWTEGESYSYQSESEQGTTSFSWTVTDVSDGEVTVELATSSPGSEDERTSTFTGPQGNIFSGDSQNLQALTFVIVQLPQQLVEGRDLSVGNSWTISSAELSTAGSQQTATPQEITVEVTGTSQVAGTQCHNIEATSDADDQTLNACVKQGWPFALSFSTSGGDNAMAGSIELTDYERP